MQDERDLINQMSIELGILPANLHSILRTAPLRYKVFKIKKKNGGEREVAQPAREVKKIQRWLIQQLIPLLPIHEAATAYRPGGSIARNAYPHLQHHFLLKLDFRDFFPSILKTDVISHLERFCHNAFDENSRRIIAHSFCWAKDRQPPLRLCIGAPSSPFISNCLMYDFDCRVAQHAAKCGIVYTRYADDLTFSSSERGVLDGMLEHVGSTLSELDYPHLILNSQKTVFASRRGRRTVTGLMLTPDGKLSIGRERKRLIRSMYHRLKHGQLSPEDREKLMGLLAFADSIEPGFSQRLASSYTE